MRRIVLTTAFVIVIAGCASSNSRSESSGNRIVERVEQSGYKAVDLKHADPASLSLWLRKRPDVGKEIASQCKAKTNSSDAWKLSNEGRICLGNQLAGF